MKQDKTNNPGIDLEALDREIASMAQSKGKAAADPLAELARIMGQSDPFSDFNQTASQPRSSGPKGTSLDDILNAPPSIILRRDQVEANFDAALSQPQSIALTASLERTGALFDDEIDLPSIDVTDASLEQAAEEVAASSNETEPDDYDLFEQRELAGAADLDALEAAMARDRAKLTATTSDNAQNTVTEAGLKTPQFDDMLAEFENAMRDAGGEKISTVSAPSLAPTVVPPPPEDLLYDQEETRTSGYSPSSGLAGAAAAGAAVIAAGSLAAGSSSQDQTYSQTAAYQEKKPKRGLMIAGGVIGIAVIGISALFAFGGGSKTKTNGVAPVIAAKTGVTKERPANPGGVDVPNQDKEVLKAPSSQPLAAERVAPREEQPVDLKQAQAAVVTPPVVRQIPGPAPANGAPITPAPPSPVVAPASPSLAGSQPVPRPVASVPIAIAGQPTPALVAAPTPITPSGVVPQAAAPVVAATTPAPTPAAPVVAAVRPADAETPAAPRRVRTVPIKTDDETVPRAQTRPVQPAPRITPAAEPASANAPLRITPQALRGSQRVASAAPSEAAEPAARPATTSGGGSGFSVQLGAEGSQDSARAKFNKIKGDHSDVLGNQNANIRNAEVNGKSIYRIRVGNMSREQAVSMCERLKADGGNCFVAKN